MYLAGIYRVKMVPHKTASAEVQIRAMLDPKKTDNPAFGLLLVNARAVNWVLSPSSAKNTMPKVQKSVLISISR